MSENDQQQTSRRTVLCAGAVAGLGLTAVACTGDGGKNASPAPTAPVELGSASDVPVGGAKLYRNARLVVSQPSKGHYAAFSAVCTHAGCVLGQVHKEEGSCPCHGSRFDVSTGKVLQGPASRPLPEVPVRVKDGKLVAGPKA
jgi:Rieske Fe-S protein